MAMFCTVMAPDLLFKTNARGVPKYFGLARIHSGPGRILIAA